MLLRILILAVALDAAWLVWSGLYKPLIVGLGLVSVVFVLWLAHRMELTARSVFALDATPYLLSFWGWLFVQIVRANFIVARIIIAPRLKLAPTMVTIRPGLAGLVGQATLANSITLTPSTVTVDAHEGVFYVHCLTQEAADELETGEMAERVARALGDR